MSDWNDAIKTNSDLGEILAKAVAAYKALSPEEKSKHDYEQRRSFVRGMCPQARDYAEWCKAVDELLPSLKRPAPLDGGWMPISDNAKDGEVVIVLMQYEQLQKAYAVRWTEYLPGQEGWCAANTYQPLIGTAKFWQPLPAPPHKAAGER